MQNFLEIRINNKSTIKINTDVCEEMNVEQFNELLDMGRHAKSTEMDEDTAGRLRGIVN